MTAADVAYHIIKQKIVAGEYKPGMRLSRRKMAEATDVSVIPVIEALKRLEEDYLVESKPKWGSFVTIPCRERVIRIYQFREGLECQIARILAETMTNAQRNEIYAIATEMDSVSYTQTKVKRELHLKFHSKLAEYTNNTLFSTALERINLFWILCRATDVIMTVKGDRVRYWHRYLVDQIASGDADAAEAAMREHVRDALEPLLMQIPEEWNKNGPALF